MSPFRHNKKRTPKLVWVGATEPPDSEKYGPNLQERETAAIGWRAFRYLAVFMAGVFVGLWVMS